MLDSLTFLKARRLAWRKLLVALPEPAEPVQRLMSQRASARKPCALNVRVHRFTACLNASTVCNTALLA